MPVQYPAAGGLHVSRQVLLPLCPPLGRDTQGANTILTMADSFKEGIQRYSPFLFVYTYYTGQRYRITFKCPACGCTSCHRDKNNASCVSFWEGDFTCDRCGRDRIERRGKELVYNYYGPCWVKEELVEPQQLSLF